MKSRPISQKSVEQNTPISDRNRPDFFSVAILLNVMHPTYGCRSDGLLVVMLCPEPPHLSDYGAINTYGRIALQRSHVQAIAVG
jgi:hypothetical protein